MGRELTSMGRAGSSGAGSSKSAPSLEAAAQPVPSQATRARARARRTEPPSGKARPFLDQDRTREVAVVLHALASGPAHPHAHGVPAGPDAAEERGHRYRCAAALLARRDVDHGPAAASLPVGVGLA